MLKTNDEVVDYLFSGIVNKADHERFTAEYFCKLEELPALLENTHRKSAFRNVQCPVEVFLDYDYIKSHLERKLREYSGEMGLCMSNFYFGVPITRGMGYHRVPASFLVQATFRMKESA